MPARGSAGARGASVRPHTSHGPNTRGVWRPSITNYSQHKTRPLRPPLKTSKENMIMKKALITGITGQDGSYLAEHLLHLGYEVWGLVRRTSLDPMMRIEGLVHPRRRIH